METYNTGVAKLLAVLALDLGVVTRLRALLGEVAGLLAVAADSLGRVLGLGALLRDVVLGVTVAANALGDVVALIKASVGPLLGQR